MLEIFSDEYLDDEIIRKIIFKYFQIADIPEEQLQGLFARVRRNGCGFIVMTNTLFDHFEYLTDEEWKNLFGFDRKNQNGQYNYQYLFLDFYLYYQKMMGYGSIEAIVGNERDLQNGDASSEKEFKDLTGARGMNTDYFQEFLVAYLKDRNLGIKAKVKTITRNDSPNENYQEEIRKALENGESVFLNTADLSLFYPVDIDGNGILDDPYSNGFSAHGFLITGITEDGKWIVSTWGKELIIDPSEISEATPLEIYSIDYE